MGKATSVILGERYDAIVARQIADGHYGSAHEIIRAALTLLEKHDRKLSALSDRPFATFDEWTGEADEKAYTHLELASPDRKGGGFTAFAWHDRSPRVPAL